MVPKGQGGSLNQNCRFFVFFLCRHIVHVLLRLWDFSSGSSAFTVNDFLLAYSSPSDHAQKLQGGTSTVACVKHLVKYTSFRLELVCFC